MKKIITTNYKETEALGQEIAKGLKSSDVVALFGDLGAGKTAFTRGLVSFLCENAEVTSPTFTIINEYMGEIPVYHFDMYRISSYEDLFDIGFFEYLDKVGICIIEWSENIEKWLPADAIRIHIKTISENVRQIIIEGSKICL